MNKTMNTTKQEHPEMDALAELHKAEMAHLSKEQKEHVNLVVVVSSGMILRLPKEVASIAMKHITETYQACCK